SRRTVPGRCRRRVRADRHTETRGPVALQTERGIVMPAHGPPLGIEPGVPPEPEPVPAPPGPDQPPDPEPMPRPGEPPPPRPGQPVPKCRPPRAAYAWRAP